MSDLMYLSNSDVTALQIPSGEMRAQMGKAFDDFAAGQCIYLPKSQLGIAPGHSFQTAIAASHRWGMAVVKWVGVVPSSPGSDLPPISALFCLNDLQTGHPIVLMDAKLITVIRTAAIAAYAAERMTEINPEVLALAGCGAQAGGHLEAFCDLYPSISLVLCYSRSTSSAEKLCRLACDRGLSATVVVHPDELLGAADVVVSTIPAAPDLVATLNASKMKPDALAIMTDLGRSWKPSGLGCFDRIITDSLDQMRHPLDAAGQLVTSVESDGDLLSDLSAAAGRQAFCFKGHAIGDLAAAVLVRRLARERDLGQELESGNSTT